MSCEGAEADHVQTMLRDAAATELQHLIHVLVMAPGEHQLSDATAWVVDAVARAEDRMVLVSRNDSGKTIESSAGAQPTGKVSPTTAHCGKVSFQFPAIFGNAMTLPRSCRRPTR